MDVLLVNLKLPSYSNCSLWLRLSISASSVSSWDDKTLYNNRPVDSS